MKWILLDIDSDIFLYQICPWDVAIALVETWEKSRTPLKKVKSRFFYILKRSNNISSNSFFEICVTTTFILINFVLTNFILTKFVFFLSNFVRTNFVCTNLVLTNFDPNIFYSYNLCFDQILLLQISFQHF